MKLKSIYRLALLGGVVAFAGCSGEEFAGASDEGIVPESVTVTLTVSRPGGASTRTQLEENGDGTLTSTWTAGDKLLVVTSEGAPAGELTLSEVVDSQSGIFTGNLSIADGTRASLWYLGAKNGTASPYTEAREADGKVTLTMDLTSLGTEFEDLKRAELLTYDNVEFTVKNGMGYVQTKGITLTQKMAMAHFTLTFPDEDFTLSEDARLRVNSENGDLPNKKSWLSATTAADATYGYTFTLGASDSDGKDIVVKDNKADLYIPIIPGSYKLKFDVTSDGKDYTYTLKNESEILAGVYYTSGKPSDASSSLYAGISVPLDPPVAVDDDLVGPVFNINGKKFRFTKANLKYNVDTKVWSLMDRQYSFICKGGWANSKGEWLSAKVEEIDLFGYGATGLYDKQWNVTARAPEYWKDNTKDKYAQYQDNVYPTSDSEANAGYTGSNLEHGIQFTNFDWGKAYYLQKTGETMSEDSWQTSYDDEQSLKYFTLSSSDWTQISSNYFMCAATITGLVNPNDSKLNEIYGLMIFGINDLEGVKSILNSLTGQVYIDKQLVSNYFDSKGIGNNYGKFSYNYLKMNSSQFDELERKGVVFLPEVGRRGPYSQSKKEGAYYTSTNKQNTNAIAFIFDGDTSPRKFKLDGDNARIQGCSVRLVKEVPEDYKDPFAD